MSKPNSLQSIPKKEKDFSTKKTTKVAKKAAFFTSCEENYTTGKFSD